MNFEKIDKIKNKIIEKVTGEEVHEYNKNRLDVEVFFMYPFLLGMLLLIPLTIYGISVENELEQVEEDGNMLYFKYEVSCYLSNNTTNDYGLTLDTCPLLDVEINLPNGRTVDRTLVSPQQWRLGIDDMPFIQLVEEDDRFVEATTHTKNLSWATSPDYTDEVLVMSAEMTFSFRMSEHWWNEDSLWVFHTDATVPECEYCYSIWGLNDSVVDHRTVRIRLSDEPFSPDNRGCYVTFDATTEAPIELINGEGWNTASASFSFGYNDIIDLCQ